MNRKFTAFLIILFLLAASSVAWLAVSAYRQQMGTGKAEVSSLTLRNEPTDVAKPQSEDSRTLGNNAPAVPTGSPSPDSAEGRGNGSGGGTPVGIRAESSPTPTPVPTLVPEQDRERGCAQSKQAAAGAGWRIISCEPLKVEPIAKPEVENATATGTSKYDRSNYGPELFKQNDPHYRWNERNQCNDESNYPGVFEERLGEMKDGYYPDWIADGGEGMDAPCHFYFHPAQGRENAPVGEDARG